MAEPSDIDPRPVLWVGHVVLKVPDPEESKRFFMELGLRDAQPSSGPVGILELRGGTHLLLLPTSEPIAAEAESPFDLMVEDLERFREQLLARGHQPTEIQSNEFHRFFTVQEPGGHQVSINSSHATGLPV